jgi:hypothetical protein
MTVSRHFVIWIRPSRSIMPWKLLHDSRGVVVARQDRETIDRLALQAMEGGSVCAIVSETMLPVEPSDTLFAKLSTGETRNLIED